MSSNVMMSSFLQKPPPSFFDFQEGSSPLGKRISKSISGKSALKDRTFSNEDDMNEIKVLVTGKPDVGKSLFLSKLTVLYLIL